MRRAVGFRGGGGSPVRKKTFPAPSGGWNARDAFDEMEEDDAIVLDNMIPGLDGVRIRKGYASHVTGIGTDVETLMEYAPKGGNNKLFAGAGTAIYDVTSAGAVGAAVVTSTTNARWSHTMHGTSAGHFLVAVNGAYGVALYNGSSWSTATYSGSVVAEDLVYVVSHQRRLYFIEKDSTSVWYLPVYSVTGGTPVEVDLSPLMSLGGKLVAIGTWSRDGGDGPDDLICFITSRGEAIIYAGTDPSSASTWGLVGIFRIAEPIGDRPIIKSGAGLAVLTSQGLLPMETVLPASISVANRLAVTDKISGAFRQSFDLYSGTNGWETIEYPKGQLVIVNVPESPEARQYVLSTGKQAWCRFTGIPATCWGLLEDNIYFGDADGTVWKFDSGESDNDEAIEADVMGAFSDCGTPNEKIFRLARPMFFAPANVAPLVEMRVDYNTDQIAETIPATETAGTAWDEGVWDVSSWGDGPQVTYEWHAVGQKGFVGTYRFAFSVEGATVRLNQTDIRFSVGAPV